MTTTVAVVIPCRNEAATIARLLDAVSSQSRRPDEIVIVDDRSTDDTAGTVTTWARSRPDVPVRVVPGSGRGVAAAMNTGIAASKAETIVRLDGHSAPAEDYIARALEALAKPRAGIVGGAWTIEPAAPTLTARAIAGAVSHPLGSGGARYRQASPAADQPESVETVPFGVFRRALWTQLGGYDESLIANEDYDFNYRARLSGADVVFDPRIRSAYQARPTLAALGRQYHRYGFWKAQMLRKDSRALHWRQVPPALVLPWVIATVAAVVAWPNAMTEAAVSVYPAVVIGGGFDAARRMKTIAAWPAAAAAFAVVHLAWSAGFLRAAFRLRAPG